MIEQNTEFQEVDFINVFAGIEKQAKVEMLKTILKRGVVFSVLPNYFTWKAEELTKEETEHLNANRKDFLCVMHLDALKKTNRFDDLQLIEFKIDYQKRLSTLLTVSNSSGKTLTELAMKAFRETARNWFVKNFPE